MVENSLYIFLEIFCLNTLTELQNCNSVLMLVSLPRIPWDKQKGKQVKQKRSTQYKVSNLSKTVADQKCLSRLEVLFNFILIL